MPESAQDIHLLLLQYVTHIPENTQRFFKTSPGSYAEHDQFLGVSVPNLRKIAKNLHRLTLTTIKDLLNSPYNEERLLALFILINQYQKAEPSLKQMLYQFYLDNLSAVNNWNLVDSSAHLILGAHTWDRDRSILEKLARSSNLWERRIAIIATWHGIKHSDLDCTFHIATILLHDTHDLIHKAVGWMLREAGKKDLQPLIHFLEAHAATMPRTMLRYAIERMNKTQQAHFRSLCAQ